jgi:hypothetical protein
MGVTAAAAGAACPQTFAPDRNETEQPMIPALTLTPAIRHGCSGIHCLTCGRAWITGIPHVCGFTVLLLTTVWLDEPPPPQMSPCERVSP